MAQIEYPNGPVPRPPSSGRSPAHLANGHTGTPLSYVTSSGDLPLARRSAEGWRVERHGPVLSTWEIVARAARPHPLPQPADPSQEAAVRGHRRRPHARVRRGPVRDATRETATVLIYHDPRTISRHQLLRILDQALVDAERQDSAGPCRPRLRGVHGVARLAAVSQFRARALRPLSAVAFVYSTIPTFRGARDTLKERRLGVDVLDSIVVIVCLLTGQLFAGAVLAWCLSAGRKLLEKSHGAIPVGGC